MWKQNPRIWHRVTWKHAQNVLCGQCSVPLLFLFFFSWWTLKWKATSVLLSTWSYTAEPKGLAQWTQSQTVENTKTHRQVTGPDLQSSFWSSESESHRVVNNSRRWRNRNGTAENKFSLWIYLLIYSAFPNSRGASGSLFLSDVFYVLTDFILSQFGASWLWWQCVRSDRSPACLCVHAVMNACVLIVRATPSSPKQTLHSTDPLHQSQTGNRNEAWVGFPPGMQRRCVRSRVPCWQSSRSAQQHIDRRIENKPQRGLFAASAVWTWTGLTTGRDSPTEQCSPPTS